jgi:hypothetical protein
VICEFIANFFLIITLYKHSKTGMDAAYLDIQVTENTVSISGDRSAETKTEDKGTTRTESLPVSIATMRSPSTQTPKLDLGLLLALRIVVPAQIICCMLFAFWHSRF